MIPVLVYYPTAVPYLFVFSVFSKYKEIIESSKS